MKRIKSLNFVLLLLLIVGMKASPVENKAEELVTEATLESDTNSQERLLAEEDSEADTSLQESSLGEANTENNLTLKDGFLLQLG